MSKEQKWTQTLIKEKMVHDQYQRHEQVMMSDSCLNMPILAPDEEQNWARRITREYGICRTLYQVTSFFRVFALIYVLGTLEVEVAIRRSSALGGTMAIVVLALFLIYDAKVRPLVLRKTLGSNDRQEQQKVTWGHNKMMEIIR